MNPGAKTKNWQWWNSLPDNTNLPVEHQQTFKDCCELRYEKKSTFMRFKNHFKSRIQNLDPLEIGINVKLTNWNRLGLGLRWEEII